MATDVIGVEWQKTGAVHMGLTVAYYGFMSDGRLPRLLNFVWPKLYPFVMYTFLTEIILPFPLIDHMISFRFG